MFLDEQKILSAIENTPVSIQAKEEGAGLVDYWVAECAELDARDETLGVEVPFFIELDANTFVVGTEDRIIRRYSDGKVCGCEWKTTKHETKFWNADVWLESIQNSHQLATYAAGLVHGQFLGDVPLSFSDPSEDMEILVRAVSKSHPPVIWPSAEGQFVKVTNQRVDAVLAVYRNEAAGIKARRYTRQLPWQVPGLHCTNMFRRVCPYLESCRKGESPVGELNLTALPQSFSPGSQVIVKRLIELGKVNEENVRDVVVLSSSSLSDLQQCPELWRRNSLKREEDGESREEMDIGTVLHAGVGELYRQMMKKENE